MTLREFRIVLPKNARGHKWLRETLATRFGGYTETEGRGGWVNPRGELVQEQVRVYDVAAPAETPAEALLTIARELLRRTGEEAIYLRDLDGEVHLVDEA